MITQVKDFYKLIEGLSDDDEIELGNDYTYSVGKLKNLGRCSISDDPYLLNFNNKKYLIGCFGVYNENGSLYWECEDCVSRILFNYSVNSGLSFLSCKGYIHKVTGEITIEEEHKYIN